MKSKEGCELWFYTEDQDEPKPGSEARSKSWAPIQADRSTRHRKSPNASGDCFQNPVMLCPEALSLQLRPEMTKEAGA